MKRYLIIFIIIFVSCNHNNAISVDKSGKKKNVIIQKKCPDLKHLDALPYTSDTVVLDEHKSEYIKRVMARVRLERYKKDTINRSLDFIEFYKKLSNEIKIIKIDSTGFKYLTGWLKRQKKDTDKINYFVLRKFDKGKYELLILVEFNPNKFPLAVYKVYLLAVNVENCEVTDSLVVYTNFNMGRNKGEVKSVISQGQIILDSITNVDRDSLVFYSIITKYKLNDNGKFELFSKGKLKRKL